MTTSTDDRVLFLREAQFPFRSFCLVIPFVVFIVPMAFTAREYRDMHFVYGECGGVARRAAERYRERYPDRRAPDHRVFPLLHERMAETGYLLPCRGEGRPIGRARDDLEEAVLNEIEDDPTTSVRRIAGHLNTNSTKVFRIIKEEGFHPYHLCPTQELMPGDLEARIEYCRFILDNHRRDPHFLFNVCWTDESCFTRQGIFNMHNYHHWALENPHLARAHSFQHQWQRLNVWGAILNDEVHIRLAPDPLNGENYLMFLEETLPELLGDGPGNRGVWFQQDGAPAHHTRAVTGMLNQWFPERWIGRAGPVRWPPRSPDLTPLDFFLWGTLKEKIYAQVVNDPEDLVARLHGAVADLTQQQLENARQAIVRRAELCLENDGGLFENLC